MLTSAFFRDFFVLKGDKALWITVALIMLFGLVVVFSARGTYDFKDVPGATSFLVKHLFNLALCGCIIIACHKIETRYYANVSRWLVLVSLVLLVLVTVLGTVSGGAKRSLSLYFITFMPTDLAKFAIITDLSVMLAKRLETGMHRAVVLRQPLFWCGLVMCLTALNSGSSTIILALSCGFLLFIGQLYLRHLWLLLSVVLVIGVVGFFFGNRGDTWSARFDTPTSVLNKAIEYFNPSQSIQLDDTVIDAQDERSLVAVASGGWFGRGAGHSVQRNFLTQSFSDFAFAILIEEWGFFGGIFMIGLYLYFLFVSIKRITFRQIRELNPKQVFGAYLAAGLAFSLVIQALMHMAVSVQLIPVTGQTLPLVSWGGSSLLFTGVSVGAILSVSREQEETPKKKR